MARAGGAEGLVVWAQAQTSGRGRQGNIWLSRPGNLFMSLVLRPETDLRDVGQLSFLAAVALARVLRTMLVRPDALSLKWPNDVLVEGRKIAGILLETESAGNRTADWVVVGIGVNITSAPEGAIALQDYARDRNIKAGYILEKLVFALLSLYDEWRLNGFKPVREEWLRYAEGIGKNISVRLPQETFTAIFSGLDETGALCVDMPDGSRKIISSGEVYTGQE